ncbi:MAG: energy transducer TonB [Bacteroidetes bacterium]|nr:energy transducer TonB [Bacteroidota bacterium]
MKSIHISKMERSRSINLRIGFAAALLIAILAFNWTTQRPSPPVFEDGNFLTEVEVKVVRTQQPEQSVKPPASLFKTTDRILEVPSVVFASPSIAAPTDSMATDGQDDAFYGKPAEPRPASTPPVPPAESDEPPFVIVEEMPRFPGCEGRGLPKKEKYECATNAMLQFIYANIHYPQLARDNGIEGTVYVRFIVEKDGSITNPTILRDIGGGCGEEALRVVKKMPTWLPGKQQGRPVRVQFNLPVKFSLS